MESDCGLADHDVVLNPQSICLSICVRCDDNMLNTQSIYVLHFSKSPRDYPLKSLWIRFGFLRS